MTKTARLLLTSKYSKKEKKKKRNQRIYLLFLNKMLEDRQKSKNPETAYTFPKTTTTFLGDWRQSSRTKTKKGKKNNRDHHRSALLLLLFFSFTNQRNRCHHSSTFYTQYIFIYVYPLSFRWFNRPSRCYLRS